MGKKVDRSLSRRLIAFQCLKSGPKRRPLKRLAALRQRLDAPLAVRQALDALRLAMDAAPDVTAVVATERIRATRVDAANAVDALGARIITITADVTTAVIILPVIRLAPAAADAVVSLFPAKRKHYLPM